MRNFIVSLVILLYSLSVLTLASNVSSNKRKKLVKRKSVVPRLLGPLVKRKKKNRKKRSRRNLRPSRKKRKRRYAFAHLFQISRFVSTYELNSIKLARAEAKKQKAAAANAAKKARRQQRAEEGA